MEKSSDSNTKKNLEVSGAGISETVVVVECGDVDIEGSRWD